ncbi:MAG: ribonucleoside-diphosphate reductase subunit alpha [gamma proteobacterium symbiont of Lucinoma myriamae]|nr:ribonucleoside-diphosphate reductase subunit alpha [gamma proteobacterium symbiont of Lucinoma myriamae]MCU7819891.1 ribonucleoside-diphosphate reductase subunit alpha [gamma proteobacterium symbiont of Lucinoma myriamae]MCU7832251.1 ribonucleoside-diphosphate reductase subunit alpha [gamma proteobacterium symbiont of Lucinoma myriamae]
MPPFTINSSSNDDQPAVTPVLTQNNSQLFSQAETIEHSYTAQARDTPDASCQVIRRNGQLTPFDRSKIIVALSKAFLAVEGGNAAVSTRIHEIVKDLSSEVVDALFRHLSEEAIVHIENIQDQVELALMRNGQQKVARAYVLYREQQAQKRLSELDNTAAKKKQKTIYLLDAQGQKKPINYKRLEQLLNEAKDGLNDIDTESVLQSALNSVYEGMSEKDLYTSLILNARSLIAQQPDYSQLAARLLLNQLRREALSTIYGHTHEATQSVMTDIYSDYFKRYIKQGVELELLDSQLLRYDLDKLAEAILPERDHQFDYLGLQTLYDRYFLHHEKIRIELPQAFFMRVAMGLAINEIDREQRTIEFYHLLSSFDFMCSTPTLFNSATLRPQLSSCYLSTVPDDLEGIFSALKDNALLSKFAGGLGNDWTSVRGLGAQIKGTNGESQGVVPFLKVANDTAVAVNQGGKRKGAMCAYLETWHIDIEDFLDLRKNTGDERRRTHDMNTANWVPDLFMKRVAEEQDWTLFSPDEVPELHEQFGQTFEKTYIAYEDKAARGEIKLFKTVKAIELWRKMLGMLFETGHPWIAFKDPCNIRYTNQHMGTVHSSNLCTEITLHTNDNEVAVCNLGSVNLKAHMNDNELDHDKLEKTISTAMRMLDNVIDYNYYSIPQARNSNLRHRPVGLGIMGFQDALYQQGIAYGSQEAVDFADTSMEAVSYFAIKASADLSAERGRYSSYEGSLWSKGILPLDSNNQLMEVRQNYIQCDTSSTLDWENLRKIISKHGMRNSNCLAIAPTATISNICGISQSIEPAYQNLYVKSNLSGEFTVVNSSLVYQLKELNLWDEVMVNDLKYYDGSLHQIDRIPDKIKSIYATAFEIDTRWLIEAASRRQKWIDQAQSLNLYMEEPSGKKLDQLYKLAWVRGLKTTYYLRSMGATHIEKNYDKSELHEAKETSAKVCSILDPDCDACQ